jgi:hypothetical protein
MNCCWVQAFAKCRDIFIFNICCFSLHRRIPSSDTLPFFDLDTFVRSDRTIITATAYAQMKFTGMNPAPLNLFEILVYLFQVPT